VSFFRRIRTVLHVLFRAEAVETELDAEVQAFFQVVVDRYIDRGLSEEEARRLARIQFGHPENVKQEVRDSRTGAALASLFRNVNYSLRSMRKAPLYAFVTIFTVGVGIGANATIFLHRQPIRLASSTRWRSRLIDGAAHHTGQRPVLQ
jgi:hypothetical protein